MFDHFMDGTGTDYYNDDLTSIVEANSTMLIMLTNNRITTNIYLKTLVIY